MLKHLTNTTKKKKKKKKKKEKKKKMRERPVLKEVAKQSEWRRRFYLINVDFVLYFYFYFFYYFDFDLI